MNTAPACCSAVATTQQASAFAIIVERLLKSFTVGVRGLLSSSCSSIRKFVLNTRFLNPERSFRVWMMRFGAGNRPMAAAPFTAQHLLQIANVACKGPGSERNGFGVESDDGAGRPVASSNSSSRGEAERWSRHPRCDPAAGRCSAPASAKHFRTFSPAPARLTQLRPQNRHPTASWLTISRVGPSATTGMSGEEGGALSSGTLLIPPAPKEKHTCRGFVLDIEVSIPGRLAAGR